MIPIYKSELQDNIAEAIKNNMSFAYETEIRTGDISNSLDLGLIKNINHPESAVASENNNWDLYPFNSLLVSVGWNANDDVFDPGETWLAKDSPILKRINLEHNEKQIIGVMTSATVIDNDGHVIASDIKSIPDVYDIVVSSVIYKAWKDKEFESTVANLINEIKDGQWFVSMECWFKNFDFAVITPEGDHKIIPRNASTAFLTKHLRLYGGSGEYQGHKLGRLLRNITFAGKGIVRKPANARSIIFASVQPFNNASFSSATIMEKEYMADVNNDVLADLRVSLAQAQKENTELRDKMVEQIANAQKAEREKLEAKVTDFEDQIKQLNDSLASKELDLKVTNDKMGELEKALTEAKKDKEKMQSEMDDMKKKQKKSDRMSKATIAGVNVAEVEKLVDRWDSVSDEQFDEIVKLHKGTVASGESTDTGNLTEASVEDDVNLQTETEDQSKVLMAQASEWLSNVLGNKNTLVKSR